MKTQQYLATLALWGLLTQLSFGLADVPANAAQGKDDRGNRSAPRENGRDGSDAQWSADPDRGWIRTDEHDERDKKQNAKPKQPGGRNKDEKRKSE
jgi:hypothetical protein